MKQKSIYAPRVVVASQQGNVIHIKSKQTGKVVLKVKLMRARWGNDDEVLMDWCDNDAGYNYSEQAAQRIAAFEGEAKS